ncbi:TPA: RNA polymerase sigma factor [Stenotrophomonas maltophilia]
MPDPALTQRLETLWRMESPVLIARLARLLGGDVGRAEELAQDTWLAALERWPEQGIPDNPGAWLMTTARNRAIDVLRQHQRVAQQHAQWGEELHPAALPAPDDSQALEDDLGDDLLRLMFVACHPVLPADARVALTLRLLGGLTTVEIARAFLQPEPTIAQRIVRAKRTLAQKQVPYEVPRADAMPERLASVLEAIYLVFNEGYAASAGDDWMRPALCEEALRLARILAHRLPVPPVLGLLALMELQASRAAARTDAQGAPVLLDQQNRARWDWPRIASLYTQLLRVMPSPVVALNRVVAVLRSEGAFAAWAQLQPLLVDARLRDYAPLEVVRAEILQALGRDLDARHAFAEAARLSQNQAERGLLRQRAGLPPQE